MIHIALTIDYKFVRYCAVTMMSIIRNNNSENIMFHIVTQNLPQKDSDYLSRLAHRNGATIAFYNVTAENMESYKVKWQGHRLSMVVFYRCVLASILPASLSKVLYLDCDTIVLGSLEELWHTDLSDAALAGVQDTIRPDSKHFERLQYDRSFGYMNGGVLLLNLDYWRKHGIEGKCKEYFIQHPERILLNDQDILNGLLHDRKVLLDVKWNVQDDFFRAKSYRSPSWKPSYSEAILHPAVLHYSGRKPWAYHAMHPLRHLFFEYQRLVLLEDLPESGEMRKRIHRFVHLLPYTLGLKKRKYVSMEDVRKQYANPI